MRPSIHLFAIAAGILTVAASAPAMAAGTPTVALASELKTVRAASLPEATGAKLICSSDTGGIVVNGAHFEASALSNGLTGVTSCRWFAASGADWVEVVPHLADVSAHLTANFIAPTSGAEPRLYELVGVGATGDFDAAVASITASFGPPQTSEILDGIGTQDTWQVPGLKIVVSQKDPQYGNLVIDYLQPDLEEMAVHPF